MHLEDEVGTDEQPGTKPKIILFWNNWNPSMGDTPLIEGLCPVTSCMFTPDQSLFNYSDVVLFFHNINGTSVPSLPRHRQHHQRFVFAIDTIQHSNKSNINLLNSLFDDNRTRYNFFNWTMTYRRDSDAVLRQHLGAIEPITSVNSIKSKNKAKKMAPSSFWMKKKSVIAQTISRDGLKTKLIAWNPSRCSTEIHREDYVNQLRRYVPVDIYGHCGSGNLSCGNSGNCEDVFRSGYKFYLAFEESWCPDYVTAEFYQALQYDTVPVVLGGADYEALAPPHSFINALDFSSVKALAEYLLLLNRTDELYAKYFSWKESYKINLEPMGGWCDLCRIAHNVNSPAKVYSDIKKWWEVDGKCEYDSTQYFTELSYL